MIECTIDELTERVIGCAIAVHRELGPGLLESIYRDCLVLELRANGMAAEVEQRVPAFYRGVQLRDDLKVDIAVDERLLIEVKCVDRAHPVHTAQLLTYVKLTGYPAGLLLNFHQLRCERESNASITPTNTRASTQDPSTKQIDH